MWSVLKRLSRGVTLIVLTFAVLLVSDRDNRTSSRSRIPVFTFQPGDVKQGALFDLGLNLYDIGRETALRVVQALDGTPVARIPTGNASTRFLLINTRALANLREPWRAPPDVLAKAAVDIDEQGRHERAEISGAAGRNR